MEDNKKYIKKLMDKEDKATGELDPVSCEYNRLKVTQLIYILLWNQTPPNEIDGKDANYDKWQEICWVDPPYYFEKIDVDEAQIVYLKKKEINISDTALGSNHEKNRR